MTIFSLRRETCKNAYISYGNNYFTVKNQLITTISVFDNLMAEND